MEREKSDELQSETADDVLYQIQGINKKWTFDSPKLSKI